MCVLCHGLYGFLLPCPSRVVPAKNNTLHNLGFGLLPLGNYIKKKKQQELKVQCGTQTMECFTKIIGKDTQYVTFVLPAAAGLQLTAPVLLVPTPEPDLDQRLRAPMTPMEHIII